MILGLQVSATHSSRQSRAIPCSNSCYHKKLLPHRTAGLLAEVACQIPKDCLCTATGCSLQSPAAWCACPSVAGQSRHQALFKTSCNKAAMPEARWGTCLTVEGGQVATQDMPAKQHCLRAGTVHLFEPPSEDPVTEHNQGYKSCRLLSCSATVLQPVMISDSFDGGPTALQCIPPNKLSRALQYKEYGYIPAALPDSRCFGEGSSVTARKVSPQESASLLQQRGGSAPALAVAPRLGWRNVLGTLAETQTPGATSAGGCFVLNHGLGSRQRVSCAFGMPLSHSPSRQRQVGHIMSLHECSAHCVLHGTELHWQAARTQTLPHPFDWSS